MIGAVLGVRDEVELIDRCLLHLRMIGIERVVACDMGSVDGTSEVLERHERDGFVRVRRFGETDDFENEMPELLTEVDTEWVLLLDADEFPVPASGDVADWARDDADVVTLPRYNVPLTAQGPAIPDLVVPARYAELLVIAEPLEEFWEAAEEQPELSWMLSPIAPRLVVRPEVVSGMPLGMHEVFPPPGRTPRRTTAGDVFVAHLPFTTLSRFERKAENVRRLLEERPDAFPPGWGRHWHRWAQRACEGRLEEEFARMVFDEPTLADLRENGRVRSAAELFEAAGVV